MAFFHLLICAVIYHRAVGLKTVPTRRQIKHNKESGAIHYNPISKVRAGLPVVQNKVLMIRSTRMYHIYIRVQTYRSIHQSLFLVLLAKCPVSLCWNRAQMRFLGKLILAVCGCKITHNFRIDKKKLPIKRKSVFLQKYFLWAKRNKT